MFAGFHRCLRKKLLKSCLLSIYLHSNMIFFYDFLFFSWLTDRFCNALVMRNTDENWNGLIYMEFIAHKGTPFDKSFLIISHSGSRNLFIIDQGRTATLIKIKSQSKRSPNYTLLKLKTAWCKKCLWSIKEHRCVKFLYPYHSLIPVIQKIVHNSM